jgi:hypothetical protein
MANRVYIEPTEFKNVCTGKVSYGVRVYDDEGHSYDDTWEAIPEDDLDVIRKVVDSHDPVISDMVNFVEENQTGFYVSTRWYGRNKIEDILEEC